MRDEKRWYLTGLIEDAESHLKEYAEKCNALQERFVEPPAVLEAF